MSFTVSWRVLRQTNFNYLTGKSWGVVILILNLNQHLDVFSVPIEWDGRQRVAVPELSVQHHLGLDLPGVLVNVQVGVDGTVGHGDDEVWRAGRGTGARPGLPYKAHPGARPRALLYLELSDILCPGQTAAPHEQENDECLYVVTAHLGQSDHLVSVETDQGYSPLLGYKLTITRESLVEESPLFTTVFVIKLGKLRISCPEPALQLATPLITFEQVGHCFLPGYGRL